MDPIKNGRAIFKKLAEDFGGQKITQISEIKRFFSELIKQTDGLVILDFLDTGNWDNFESFELRDDGFLTLIWHDYRTAEESEEDKEIRQMIFPASLYSLGISISSITLIIGEKMAIFLLNGYAKTEKEINKLYKSESSEYKIYNDRFFEKRIVRKISGKWEVIDFHCTPIYSIAIIPKNSRFSSLDSKHLLYTYNIQDLTKRLALVLDALEATKTTDHDLICEKVNTARRILESALKIECCYHEVEIKGDYSKVLLGPLLNYVRGFQEEEYQPVLGKMAELLNEFSHDSGKPIDIEKAKLACILVMTHLELLRHEIRK
ncbi:MAG TPA: hypothetical protein VMC09_11390 [Anaerolineales bacterium]|nr:hypothetical protein [Anaerolineales bacterium]